MSTRRGFAYAFLTAALSLGCLNAEVAQTPAAHPRKTSKKQQLPPLPSGPRGPVPQMPLDTMQPVAPQVSFRDGQLTIVAPNSTLGDILRAVRKQTSADIEIPPTASERVVTHLGPGPARDVVAELLNGSKFNYVLMGSPANAGQLMRVVLVAKSGGDNQAPGLPPQGQSMQQNMAPPPSGDAAADTPDAEPAPEENADDNTADQNAVTEPDPQQPAADQPGIKTPQQLLQEMQQRQLQMQQQMAPNQPPAGGTQRPE
jgi:hypothetical protein